MLFHRSSLGNHRLSKQAIAAPPGSSYSTSSPSLLDSLSAALYALAAFAALVCVAPFSAYRSRTVPVQIVVAIALVLSHVNQLEPNHHVAFLFSTLVPALRPNRRSTDSGCYTSLFRLHFLSICYPHFTCLVSLSRKNHLYEES